MRDLFCFTDVHGMYDLYKAVMNYCIEQDPECSILYLGDACDRGPSGYRIMKELLDNPKVLYLKGNHEDMFVHAAWAIERTYHSAIDEDSISKYLLDCEFHDWADHAIRLSLYNGGYSTLHDWMLDGMPSEFINKINDLPLTFSYENLDFCHAGGNYKAFQQVSLNEYKGEPVDKDDMEMLIWDRNYLGQGWMLNRTCIFGHTPTNYLAAKYYGKDKSTANIHPCAYYATLDDKWTGRKIDMDTAAVFSGKAYVLNCLTMKAQGFKIVDIEEKKNVKKIECIQF